MIAKISTAENLYGGLTYNLKKVAEKHAFILEGSAIAFMPKKDYTMEDVMEMFSENLNGNLRTKKPVVHISLNPSPDDRIDNADYACIARHYLDEMGFCGQPFVIFKHEDIERHHVHILTTNIKSDGRKINDRFYKIKNRRVCREIEHRWELQSATEQRQQHLCDFQNYVFDYEKSDIKTQIKRTVNYVNRQYHFSSDKQYRALMKLFGIEAEFIQSPDDPNLPLVGIVFHGLNRIGNRVSSPIKSSLIQKRFHKKILGKFKTSVAYIANVPDDTLKSKLDIVKRATSIVDFYETLSEQNMDIVFRRTGSGRIYGATIIDHDSGVVLNGSKLGKAYSANVFNDLLNSFDNRTVGERSVSDTQQHNALPDLSGLTFSGSSGAFGHYERVGDKEKESENDKLNREIKKRKNKKSNMC